MEKVGFYAGSFDPFTKGHMAVVCEALQIFDRVIIAVGNNPDKKTMFNVAKRVEMIKSSLSDFRAMHDHKLLSGARFSLSEKRVNDRFGHECIIDVVSYDGLTVDAAIKYDACCLIRGERMVGDHDAEMQQALFNRELLNIRGFPMGIVFIPVPSASLTYVSSGNVKNLCDVGEYIAVNKYVYPSVHKALMEIYLKKRFMEQNFALDREERWKQLVLEYNNPARTYHNLSHVAYCLNIADLMMKGKDLAYHEVAAIKQAIFYHDIVIGLDDAEEKSAEIAKKAYLRDEVGDLIMSTKIGTQPDDVDIKLRHMAEIVHDADLAILADNDNYGIYAQQVRCEYDVDTQEYAKRRIEVLTKITEEYIFFTSSYGTAFDTDQWGDAAEANISREIAFWQSRL